MSAFHAATLLSAWEEGVSQAPTARALTLLSWACAERPWSEWARAPLGDRDARLLRLHEEMFGARLEAVAECPSCQERLELSFTTHEIAQATDVVPADTGHLRIETDGYEVEFRVPNSQDVLEAVASTDGTGLLLERCVRRATRHGQAAESAELPEAVRNAIAERMRQADPHADMRAPLLCPACGHAWTMPFDIVAYLWSEIDDEARRLLLQVHTLASRYGWSEGEILAMSARRRRMYLDMLGA